MVQRIGSLLAQRILSGLPFELFAEFSVLLDPLIDFSRLLSELTQNRSAAIKWLLAFALDQKPKVEQGK
jgi:hypothetical protein